MYSQQYYQGPNAVQIRNKRDRTVNTVIPGVFPGLLGAFLLFLWIAIIILEIVSVYYDAGRGTVYAGFWCSIIFFLTWISMFCYLCCGKSSGCGSYLLVLNGINLIFAIILLVFTAMFINDPCLCYSALCRIPTWDYINDIIIEVDGVYLCNSRTFRKVPVLKGLLACAVLMAVCNIVFILTYLIVSIQLRLKGRSYKRTPDIVYQQQSGSVRWSEQPSHYPSDINYIPRQYQPSYPMQSTQRTSQFPSAPPYDLYSAKF